MTVFGVSGEWISLALQIIAFIGCFVIGVCGCRKPLLNVALVIGISTNIIGQIIFAGGGPGAFVGFIGIPLYCLISAYIGRGIWWLYAGRHQKP